MLVAEVPADWFAILVMEPPDAINEPDGHLSEAWVVHEADDVSAVFRLQQRFEAFLIAHIIFPLIGTRGPAVSAYLIGRTSVPLRSGS